MIKINGKVLEADFISQYGANSTEGKVLDILMSSSEVYNYSSLNDLKFELSVRKSLVNASKSLNKSSMDFSVFRKSRCNPEFWYRTGEGGFELKSGVKPSDAIKDIYINSSMYATECATAMVIVYYKALVDVLPEQLFNRLFPRIYLMNWQHLSYNLGIVDYIRVADYLPGDCRYFKNPDVDPVKPEWQGENVFLLDNGLYYGHGIGIASGERIIELLNKKRRKGSTVSAYLLPSAKRLDFKYLSNKYYEFPARQKAEFSPLESSWENNWESSRESTQGSSQEGLS